MTRDEVLTAEEVEGKSNTELLSKHILELQADKGRLTDKVNELEAQIERNKIDLAISEHDREHDDYELTEVYTKVEQLEEENADLKEEINKIAFARGNLEEENAELKRHIKADCIDCADYYKNKRLEKENAEFKKQLCAFDEEREKLRKENAELKDELTKWKDEWQEQVQKATDEGYARTLQTIQLTKAKELIEDMYDAIPSSHSDYYKDVMERARQFLSEVEK